MLRRQPLDDETWAPGYPSLEQVDYLEAYLVELRASKPDTKWQAQIRRRSDGCAIGGAGVTGPPDATGAVVVGFEVDPTAGGEDYGVEIVSALLSVARGMGARRAVTSTPPADGIRPRAYLLNGFEVTDREVGAVHFTAEL